MNQLKVDIVLTAYKKIDVLQHQINALKNQTYEVNNIYLFKDGIDSYYDIVLKDSFLKQFKDTKILEENVGVWGRFEYAYSICKADYVCIFDDDTIPGNKWIENCVRNYLNKPGVYGTNGILVTKPEQYPYEMINVGWHNPNKETIQVDFVGHAWFLKTEWLKWMLELKNKYNYKYVGEDMALSFACQKRGILTYVPPHPFKDVQLWGSQPAYGNEYGRQGSALSLKSSNLEAMNGAIIEMKNDGWKFIMESKCEFKDCVNDLFETQETKKEVIKKDLIDFTSKYQKVYLYGAGRYGAAFYEYLESNGFHVSGFVVSNLENEYVNINGQFVKIISIDELNLNDDAGIILSLGLIHHGAIRRRLDKMLPVFMSEETAYDYNDVLKLVLKKE